MATTKGLKVLNIQLKASFQYPMATTKGVKGP